MTATLRNERDNLFRLDLTGLLRHDEFSRAQQALVVHLSESGQPARLLIQLDDFAGWDPSGEWSDLNFFATYGSRIERIAIVGEERWKELALMFAGAELRLAPVRFFPRSELADAREWLNAP
jgi:hypothetical protein